MLSADSKHPLLLYIWQGHLVMRRCAAIYHHPWHMRVDKEALPSIAKKISTWNGILFPQDHAISRDVFFPLLQYWFFDPKILWESFDVWNSSRVSNINLVLISLVFLLTNPLWFANPVWFYEVIYSPWNTLPKPTKGNPWHFSTRRVEPLEKKKLVTYH